MSDTPRTDYLQNYVKLPEDLATHAMNLETLCKQLEREITTLRQQLADMTARAEEAERKLINPDVEKVARVFHDAYEDAALRHGWKTQDSCRVPFESLPVANKAAMLAATQSAIQALEGTK
jgi:hypothetical protein